MKHDFHERKERRIEYAEFQAIKNAQASEHYYVQASRMAKAIPFGQPILIGHHSEKRDRNYRSKIHDTFGKSFQAQEKANYYDNKAETIKNNRAIFSDDPDAVVKLQQKIANAKAIQQFMVAANKCIRKQDKEGFLKLPHATPELWDKLNTPDRVHGKGFPHYATANNNANIRRMEQRLAGLTRDNARQRTETTGTHVRLVENPEAGRVQLFFPGKPDEATRKDLKKHGFRFSYSEGAWQRHLNTQGIWIAQDWVKRYEASQTQQ